METRGYQYVNIESVALFMRSRDADLYLSPSTNAINEFESLLLSTSVADVLIERFMPDIPLVDYETHRKTLLYQINALSDIPNISEKKFVFLHLWAPHPPFVFDEFGNPTEPNRPYFGGDGSGFFGGLEEYNEGYSSEMLYLNTLLRTGIDAILANTRRPAIIVLQGDHGPGSRTSFSSVDASCLHERFSILNAYYFPDNKYDNLTSDITPVNSFRVILNQYFGASLDLLENKHYYSAWLAPYRLIDVTGRTTQSCETDY
jgi:hypothetical protein